MTCPHAQTFECHGTQRCSVCYIDSYLLHDGTRVWPSQEHPAKWDNERVANWFLDNRIHLLPQGCDGFEFCRDNKAEPSTYGYVWVEATLDLDYLAAWLLDVRRHDGQDESRQFIFVASGQREEIVVASHDISVWRADGRNRLISALHWFAEQVDAWLDKEEAHQ